MAVLLAATLLAGGLTAQPPISAITRGSFSAHGARAQSDAPKLWVHLDRATITGTVSAGRVVSATLLADGGTGSLKASGEARADEDGTVSIRLRRPEGAGPQRSPVLPIAGDVLWVDVADGDPHRLTIPRLDAVVDADAIVVAGKAPAGESIELDLLRPKGLDEGDELIASAAARSGVDGRWRAEATDWQPRTADEAQAPLTLQPPRHGRLRWRASPIFTLERTWAAIALTGSVGSSVLAGVGAPFRTASVTVTDSAGLLVGTALGSPSGLEGTVSWAADIRDGLALSAQPVAGDLVSVRIGDQEAQWRVPKLAAALETRMERVAGATIPGRTVEVRMLQDGVFERTVPADPDGRFVADFVGEVDLNHTSSVFATVRDGRHAWQRRVRSPALTLDLDRGRLYGWAEAETSATLIHERAGGAIAAWSLGGGSFSLSLGRGTAEHPDPALPGDVLRLRMPERNFGDREVELVVPTFEIGLDRTRGRIVGRVDPPLAPALSHHPALFGSPAVARWGGGAIQATVGPDGRLDGSFADASGPLPPGLVLRGRLTLPEGHALLRRTATPVLELQVDGPAICGFGPPRSPVSLDVRDERGKPTGRLRTTTGPHGRFVLLLPSAIGEAPRLGGGWRVRADVAGEIVAAVVPTVTVTTDWATGVVAGRIPVDGGTWTLRWPSRGCVAGSPDGVPQGGVAGIALRPGATGTFRATFATDPDNLTARGLAIEQLSQDGHRLFRSIAPAALDVYVGRSRVTVRGEPYAPLDLVLRDEHGSPRAWLSATADGSGRGRGAWRDRLGNPIEAGEGDQVAGRAGGDGVSIDVEPLSFDFAPGAGIVGRASPGRELALRLLRPVDAALGSRGLELRLSTDENGRFALSEAPPRAGWRFDDLLRIELSVRAEPVTLAPHRLVAVWDSGDGAGTEDRSQAWLPWLGRRR